MQNCIKLTPNSAPSSVVAFVFDRKYKYGQHFVRYQLITKFFWYQVVNHVDSFTASVKIESANIEQICNLQKFSPTKLLSAYGNCYMENSLLAHSCRTMYETD